MMLRFSLLLLYYPGVFVELLTVTSISWWTLNLFLRKKGKKKNPPSLFLTFSDPHTHVKHVYRGRTKKNMLDDEEEPPKKQKTVGGRRGERERLFLVCVGTKRRKIFFSEKIPFYQKIFFIIFFSFFFFCAPRVERKRWWWCACDRRGHVVLVRRVSSLFFPPLNFGFFLTWSDFEWTDHADSRPLWFHREITFFF